MLGQHRGTGHHVPSLRLRRPIARAGLSAAALLTVAGAVLAAALPGVAGAASGTAVAAAPTAPPPVTILASSGRAAPGDIFITPTGDTSTYANGAEILDRHGNVVWFHAARRD